MKRNVLYIVLSALTITLISWGPKGHQAIAVIAEKHLTPNARSAINAYLKSESMAKASTWPDEISMDKRYGNTSSWHYINLPLGLTRSQFTDYVLKQKKDNVYTAILKAEADLKNKTLNASQKAQALKFLIHLIADAHQPMHVSRAEDKGGNNVQIRFKGKGTNLHSLWDGKLIDHEGFNYQEMARKYDWANADQTKKWQSDAPMQWLWESYQVSSQIYDEIQPGMNIDDAYYKKSLSIIHIRVLQAGIRLAGELNKLFANQPATKTNKPVAANDAPVIIKLSNVKNSIGKRIRVTGKVYGQKDIGSMVLVNMGAAYPNQLLTLALKNKAKIMGSKINGRTITVEGNVKIYKGKPEMVITDPTCVILE